MTEILPAAETLPAEEAATLAECEQVIERGLETFLDVGNALSAIRGGRLYRETHLTFEDYCRDRWNLSRPRAYELIGAARTVSAMADTLEQAALPPPSNERQVRELSNVPPDRRAEVWRHAIEQTDGRPTAAAVRQAKAILAAQREAVSEEKTREMQERFRRLDEQLHRDRETCGDDGWLHTENPVTLGAKLAAIADGVRQCAPRIYHGNGLSAWAFGYFYWQSLDEIEPYAPELIPQIRAELNAATADYEAALKEAVKDAKSALGRIEQAVRSAAGETQTVVIATQHTYRRPLASGWLGHAETVWHGPFAACGNENEA